MKKILIAGASGLIGSRLSEILANKGYIVSHLGRSQQKDSTYKQYIWNVENGTIDAEALREADCVINLAGAGIADARWTDARKALIISSRTDSAKLIKNTLLQLGKKNTVYISAAAIGIYGNRDATLLTESDVAGEGFLSESCIAWEAAANSLQGVAERVAILRIGVVLSTKGGALAKTITPLRFGLASYFGNGAQYFSWIHIDDMCHIFLKCIEDSAMNGVYNAVAPQTCSNFDFTKVLKKVYSGFSILAPVPTFVLRILFGEMAEVVLSGSNVSSEKIQNQGFTFQFPDANSALKDLLERGFKLKELKK